MASFLCVGDLHVKLSNLSTIRKIKAEIIRVIREKKPDYVVLMGDMHDTFEKMHLQVWNEIINFIKDLTANHPRVIYLVGNHDAINNQIFFTDDHFFNAFKEWAYGDSPYIVDEPVVKNFGGVYAGFLPYVPPGRFTEAVKHFPANLQPEIIFAHQEFRGASFGSLVSEKGDEWPEDAPVVVSGHIHEHAWLQKNILYVGTPYQTNFGESPDKSISLISVENGNVTEERIYLNIPKKLIIQTSAKEFADLPFNDFDECKIFVHGTTEEILALKKTKKYKEIDKRAKVVLKPSDKSTVKRNVNNLGFMQLIQNEIEKESETVKAVFREVIDATNSK